MCSKKYIPVTNPMPANLRHTAANRNENSNNQKLKRDPLNKPYAFYTINDMSKIFNISRHKIVKLINAGKLKAIEKEGPIQKRVMDKNAEDKDHKLCESKEFVILAPDALWFSRVRHSLYFSKRVPVSYPPILILAAAQFIDDYNPDGTERPSPLSAQTGHTIQNSIEEILAIIKSEREPFEREMLKILGQTKSTKEARDIVAIWLSPIRGYVDIVDFKSISDLS